MGGAGMSRVLTAWIEGAKRVGRAPALLAAVWIATTVLALPLAAVLRDMIAQQLGHSMTAEIPDACARAYSEFLAKVKA